MAHILCKSDQIAEKSWDTQLFIMTDKKQDFLLSFSGFLDSEKASLSTFEPHEAVMYTKGRATKIKADLKKENHRQVEITSSLKQRIADWLMETEVKITL
ncbi:MAG: hypothetical protein PQJ35_01945 [Sphaerochaetaceae bacterium]|nr:hypothetical protein [Sphaerochaetaceae bacterium]